MSEIDVVTKNVGVDQFPHVLLFVVAGHCFVLELAPYFGHFFIHYFLFLVFGLTVADVSDEQRETTHHSLGIGTHLIMRYYLNVISLLLHSN